MNQILVTGAAGFIGYHLSNALLERGMGVLGLDNLNDYYDVALKETRLARLQEREGFEFLRCDLDDREGVSRCFADNEIDLVVNLAAQAGVRYSRENPHVYVSSNVNGFLNLLEGCREAQVKHLVYASSSSVYGANTKLPFSVGDSVDHPLSMYAATKKANELMAHVYSNLYALPTTGLRFFTVYGPWGRPDMALFLFTRAILNGDPIDVFNDGKMKRDFTYVADIVESICKIILGPVPEPDPGWTGESPDPSTSFAPYRVYNIGNHKSVELERFIAVLEESLGIPAVKNYLPLQPGDVPETYANIDKLSEDYGFRPQTSIEEGIPEFVKWYRSYYGI